MAQEIRLDPSKIKAFLNHSTQPTFYPSQDHEYNMIFAGLTFSAFSITMSYALSPLGNVARFYYEQSLPMWRLALRKGLPLVFLAISTYQFIKPNLYKDNGYR